jgi:hypothetical protein
MSTHQEPKPGPVEVWLTKTNIEVACMVVREDESITDLEVRSLSMRGAQREMTGWLMSWGYVAAGRWAPQTSTGAEVEEYVRTFKPGPEATYVR